MKLEDLKRIEEFVDEDKSYIYINYNDYRCISISTQMLYLTIPDLEIFKNDLDDVNIILKSIGTYMSFYNEVKKENYGIYIVGEWFFQIDQKMIIIPKGCEFRKIKDKIYNASNCFLFANVDMKELIYE